MLCEIFKCFKCISDIAPCFNFCGVIAVDLLDSTLYILYASRLVKYLDDMSSIGFLDLKGALKIRVKGLSIKKGTATEKLLLGICKIFSFHTICLKS